MLLFFVHFDLKVAKLNKVDPMSWHLLRKFLDAGDDSLRIKILVVDLLEETTTTFLGGTHVAISGSETALEQPSTELRAKLRLRISIMERIK